MPGSDFWLLSSLLIVQSKWKLIYSRGVYSAAGDEVVDGWKGWRASIENHIPTLRDWEGPVGPALWIIAWNFSDLLCLQKKSRSIPSVQLEGWLSLTDLVTGLFLCEIGLTDPQNVMQLEHGLVRQVYTLIPLASLMCAWRCAMYLMLQMFNYPFCHV